MSIGDFDTSSVVYLKFTTIRPSTGAPYTLAGSPAISVYKDNSTTQSTTGVTLTVDFDSVTGFNHVAIDTSADGTFYSAGSFFEVVLTAGTVDSVSAAGYVVGRFSLRKNSALKPTVAGRTLDVSSGGEAGLDWANVGSPTTTVGLTGTTISSSQTVASVSGSVGSVTGGVTVTTNNDKTGYSLTQSFPTNFASMSITAGGAVTAGTVSDKTGYSLSSSQTFNLTGNITGNLSGSVGSVTTAVTLPTIPTDWITSTGIASSAVTKIQSGLSTSSELQQVAASLPASTADAVWDDMEADHAVTGSMGAAQGRTTAIKAKTDNLPSDPADASDIAASFTTVNSKLDAIDDYVDSEVAAIKLVTDRLSGMLVQDGVVYQFTANALENGSGGGGGSTYIVVHPGYASRPEKVAGTTIVLYHQETGSVGPIRVQRRSDDTYSDVDLTEFTGLHVVIKDYEMTEIDDISSVTVSGTGNSQFSFPVTTTVTGTVTADTQEEWHYYSLRDTDGVVICTGRLRVREG